MKEISEDALPHAGTVVEWHIPIHTLQEIFFVTLHNYTMCFVLALR